jgi:hypothetical protein
MNRKTRNGDRCRVASAEDLPSPFPFFFFLTSIFDRSHVSYRIHICAARDLLAQRDRKLRVSLFVSILPSADAARGGDRTTLLSEISRGAQGETCLPRCNCNFMQISVGAGQGGGYACLTRGAILQISPTVPFYSLPPVLFRSRGSLSLGLGAE